MRNALVHAGKTQQRMVSAAIGTVFVQDSADAARTQLRSVADHRRGKFPKLGALMDEAENDVLAFMTFRRAHWRQIYSTNPLERLNAEIKRRANVVGIFPNDAFIVRLVGAMTLEQNDERSLNRRYMQLEGPQTLSDTVPTPLLRPAEYRASQLSPGCGLTPCAWTRPKLIHASQGVLRVSTDQGHWVVPPQRAVWVPAGVRHAVGSTWGYQLQTLYVTRAVAPRLESPAVVPVSALLGEFLKAGALLGADYSAQGPVARLMRVLLEHLPAPSQALHLPDPQDRRLRRLVAPLHRNPADTRSFATLAAEVGLSARHASWAFVAETGMTPGHWRTQRRLLAALERLAQRQPVRRVAMDVGYADPYSFVAVFQRAFGVTPARYFGAQSAFAQVI
jgi:AraC-like DNA-binding protein